VDADCNISRKTAVLSEDEFLSTEYIKNPMKYRCRRREIKYYRQKKLRGKFNTFIS